MEIRENSKSLIELRSIVESLGGKIKNGFLMKWKNGAKTIGITFN